MERTNYGKENETLLATIRKNFFQIASILVVILNLWLANKLTPLASDIKVIGEKVYAIEDKLDKYDSILEQVTMDKVEIVNIKNTLTEIKTSQNEINRKMEQHFIYSK